MPQDVRTGPYGNQSSFSPAGAITYPAGSPPPGPRQYRQPRPPQPPPQRSGMLAPAGNVYRPQPGMMTSGMEAKQPAFLNPNMTSGMESKRPAFLTRDSVSDERSKNRAQGSGQSQISDEDRRRDEEETRKFMEGSTPVPPATDEEKRREAEYATQSEDAAKKRALGWLAEQDRGGQRDAEKLKDVPVLGGMVKKAATHEGETEDQKLRRAVESKKTENKILSTQKSVDDWAGKHLPAFLRGAAIRAPAGIGTRPQLDPRQPGSIRQPVSFTYGPDPGPEKADTRGRKPREAVTSIETQGGNPDAADRHFAAMRREPQPMEYGSKSVKGGSTAGESKSDERVKNKARMSDAEAAKLMAMSGGMLEGIKARTGGAQRMSDAEAARLMQQSDGMLEGTKTQLSGAPNASVQEAGKRNTLIEMQKDANRQLRGETYTYKPGYGEDTGQLHHGFMAQNLEKNPITATAVREDGTGVKKVNNEDALRVTAAGVASNQEQIDDLEQAISALAARRGRR